jgi:hypothetical protein
MKRSRKKSRKVSPGGPKAASRRGSRREFCVVHPDGRVSDAELHEPILDNPKAEAAIRDVGKAIAQGADLSEQEIKKLFE